MSPIHPAKKEALQKKVVAFFEACEVNGGWPDFGKILTPLETLTQEVQKDYKDTIGMFQIFDLLREKIDQMLSSVEKENQKGALSSLVDVRKFSQAAEEIVDFLITIPRKYYFFFKMLQFSDTPYSFTQITKDIHLVRVFEEETADLYEKIIRKRAGYSEAPRIGAGFYLRVQVEGYCDGSDSNTIEEAMAKFKQYILMGMLSGKFELSHNHWLDKAHSTVHYVDINDPNKLGELSISESLSNLMKKVKLREEHLKKALEPEPEDKPKSGFGLLGLGLAGPINPYPMSLQGTKVLESSDSNPNTASIKNALEWGFDSLASEGDQTMSFMQICIALEAILGIDSKNIGVTERLGDRCAYLVGRNVTERKKIREEFDKFYKVRSHLIHGRSKRLMKDDRDWLYWGRNMLYRVIHKELYSAKDLEAVTFEQLK